MPNIKGKPHRFVTTVPRNSTDVPILKHSKLFYTAMISLMIFGVFYAIPIGYSNSWGQTEETTVK